MLIRSLQQVQQSNQGHSITYTQQPISMPTLNILHLTISEINLRRDFKGQGHNSKFKSKCHQDSADLNFHLMPQPSVNFLHLKVLEIQPTQDFSRQPLKDLG